MENLHQYEGIELVMPRRIIQTLEVWSRYRNLSIQKERWKIIPTCIWWSVWKEEILVALKTNCIVLFHFWGKQENMEDLESIIDVLGNRYFFLIGQKIFLILPYHPQQG